MPVVWQDSAEILDQPETLLDLTQEHQTAVAGDVAAIERRLDFLTIEAGKKELGVGAVWPWRGFFGLACKAHNPSSLLRETCHYFALM
jgi:hypothetical protein